MPEFPFTAILGQEAMQSALLATAVDPTIGGVLVRGEKGTAKSTAVRALASLLPPVEVVTDCPYNCAPEAPSKLHAACRVPFDEGQVLPRTVRQTPFVDLPLSTTEDRLIGTIHLGKTLESGERHYEPGLLAAAHRGILYVDEVNLLPDHLVDLLLDVATSGINLVEREGLRVSHPSRFLLVGSMNPEEGELRPQFLDRFGLCVAVGGLTQPELRRQVVINRMAFDQNPQAFADRFASREALLRDQVNQARQRLPDVVIAPELIDKAVQLAAAARAQGHRAELAMVRTARALAALCDRNETSPADLEEAARFALPHRVDASFGASPEELSDKIETLLKEQAPGLEQTVATSDPAATEDLMDNMDFPGSAAAGSMLFTYLKKKLKTASSAPTKTSI